MHWTHTPILHTRLFKIIDKFDKGQYISDHVHKTTYSDTGVDIALGDDVSKMFYNAAKLTWQNRKGTLGEVVVPVDDFTGTRFVRVGGLPPGTVMNIGFDGIGTKIEIAERMQKHDTIAFDLFAMVCDDAIVRGAEPILIGSIFDVQSLKDKQGKDHLAFVKQLAQGYVEAAKEANVAIINGEVAELGIRVTGYGDGITYNWGAGVVWFANEQRLFTGHQIQEGDFIIALREHGFRSNGLTMARKAFEKAYGNAWHTHLYQGKSIGELVLTPSRIYTKAVVDMFGGYDLTRRAKAPLHGVAHITGGGMPGKIMRILRPSGLGASIQDAFVPPAIMLHCQEKGNISDEEAYRTWNMGQGMVLFTQDAQSVVTVASSYNIEAKVIGKITKTPGVIIVSKGFSTPGRELIF